MKNYYSNGKLLITGEYVILDGAKALAVPSQKGQNLEVAPIDESKIIWESYNHKNVLWFRQTFDTADFFKLKKQQTPDHIAERLRQIFQEAHLLNPSILEKSGFSVKTKLDFPIDWGLGSSSTLINNIAQWFEVDSFLLLERTFGGSGYDIACAQYGSAITYQLPERRIEKVDFNPSFKENLFFVHLKNKKDSREAILHYKKTAATKNQNAIEEISEITEKLLTCTDLFEFEKLIDRHEKIISTIINQKTIKAQLFQDYPRSIKSLGGWGGDFILAVGTEEEKEYFRKKDYPTIIDYSQMVLE